MKRRDSGNVAGTVVFKMATNTVTLNVDSNIALAVAINVATTKAGVCKSWKIKKV